MWYSFCNVSVDPGSLNTKFKGILDSNFEFMSFDANDIPLEDESVDMVIANHMLFYFDKPDKVLSEIKRVLKPEGVLFSSTYGSKHMKEISDLCKEFDERCLDERLVRA